MIRMGSGALGVFFSIALVLVCLGVVFAFAQRRWKTLGSELFSQLDVDGESANSAAVTSSIKANSMLRDACEWLAKDPRPEAVAGLASLQAIERTPTTVAAFGDLIDAALDRGEARSLLLRTPEAASYLVVVPNRYDGGRGARRHGVLADDWPRHLTALAHSLADHGSSADRSQPGQVSALLFFVDPDGESSSLVLSFTDGARVAVPRALVGVGAEVANLECAEMILEFRRAA